MADKSEVPNIDTFLREIDFDDFALEDFLERFKREYDIEQPNETIDYAGEAAGILEFLLETYAYVYDIDTGWGIEGATLARLHNEIMETKDEIENDLKDRQESQHDEIQEEVDSHVFRTKSSDDILLFYTLAIEMINELSIDLAMLNVIDEDRQNKSSERFLENLSQYDREELLFRTGSIDGELKGMMADTRQRRNNLVHDLRERHLLESSDNIVSEMEETIKTVNRLHTETEGFSLLFGED